MLNYQKVLRSNINPSHQPFGISETSHGKAEQVPSCDYVSKSMQDYKHKWIDMNRKIDTCMMCIYIYYIHIYIVIYIYITRICFTGKQSLLELISMLWMALRPLAKSTLRHCERKDFAVKQGEKSAMARFFMIIILCSVYKSWGFPLRFFFQLPGAPKRSD
jgi:hypothetical protein